MLGKGLKGWQNYFEFMREKEKDGQTYMKPEFKREERYIVLKRKDVNKALTTDLWLHLEEICDTVNYFRGLKGPLECVVVEKDWPEYEVVWKLIEGRMTNEAACT